METLNALLNAAMVNTTRHLNRLRTKALARLDMARTKRAALRKQALADPWRPRALAWLPRRTAIATLLLCIAFFVAAQIGLILHFPHSLVYFVWPPSVVVFVALTLSPRRVWWVYALALFPVHLLVEWRTVAAPLTSLALFYAIVWIQALVGVVCLGRFTQRPFRLNSLRALIIFLLSGAGVAALAEALTLATVLSLTSGGADFWLSFTQTFFADCLTMLVLAPALVSGYALTRQVWLASGTPTSGRAMLASGMRGVNDWIQSISASRVTEAFLLALGLLGISIFAFGGYVLAPNSLPALLYVVLPLLLWSAIRFGLGATSLALCGLTLLAIMYAIEGRGPFSTLTTTEDLLSLQIFFIAIAAPMLALAMLTHEHQQAQQELKQSEARYRAVVSNFPNGAVLLFDAQLRHIFADGQGVHGTGLFERVVGATVWEAFPATLAAHLAPRYQAALAGIPATFDLLAGHRTYFVQTLPVQQNQAPAGMAVMQDVTEQRRAEALAALDGAKTAFFSNVSHEFRTPLTLMLGPIADALIDREEPLPPRQRERLEMIQRSGQRLHKLVNTLLDFSRIEAGRIQATYEPTDIATLTEELASVFRSAVERAGLQLVVDCAPLTNLPQPVYVDRDMWEKIVLNLLSNALKFTFEGAITVTMRTTGARHQWVELEVRDTGTGIADEALPHLFERFYSVQGARARTHEGTGIGLAMVQELVRLHGGAAQVTSALGVGSSFTITMPTGSAHLPVERIAGQAQLSEAPRQRRTRLTRPCLSRKLCAGCRNQRRA